MIDIIFLVIILVLLVIIFLLILKLGFGISKTTGELNVYSKDIRDTSKSLEQIFRSPTERGFLGELSLETILSDQLPPEMFGIRKRILDGKIPDAHIKTKVGYICIDSKFPLDNFRKMVEEEDPAEKEKFKKKFLNNVQEHFDKIAYDYVCPDKGSAEYAYVYIPSESIYYFLITQGIELVKNSVKKSVQIVSPLTLSHKIALIKQGLLAFKTPEEIKEIKNDVISLSRLFEDLDRQWGIFYQTHLKNFKNKANEVNAEYNKIKEEFDRIYLEFKD